MGRIANITFKDALAVLDRWCIDLCEEPAPRRYVSSLKPNRSGKHDPWWLDYEGPTYAETVCKAYLYAYLEITDGESIPGDGIPLIISHLHLDRGVMKQLLLAGYVTLGRSKKGHFELTEEGRRFIG